LELWFKSFGDDDFTVFVLLKKLDKQFSAVIVRLFATVENHPNVWMETATVLKLEIPFSRS
jgi:hypothetical protein